MVAVPALGVMHAAPATSTLFGPDRGMTSGPGRLGRRSGSASRGSRVARAVSWAWWTSRGHRELASDPG